QRGLGSRYWNFSGSSFDAVRPWNTVTISGVQMPRSISTRHLQYGVLARRRRGGREPPTRQWRKEDSNYRYSLHTTLSRSSSSPNRAFPFEPESNSFTGRDQRFESL